jgi:hypothetical protein
VALIIALLLFFACDSATNSDGNSGNLKIDSSLVGIWKTSDVDGHFYKYNINGTGNEYSYNSQFLMQTTPFKWNAEDDIICLESKFGKYCTNYYINNDTLIFIDKGNKYIKVEKLPDE